MKQLKQLTLKMNYDNLPNELKANFKFCMVKANQYCKLLNIELAKGLNIVDAKKNLPKGIKAPMQTNFQCAMPNDDTTFCGFDECQQALNKFGGIGILIQKNLCAIDIDNCIDDKGTLNDVAKDIIESFKNTYIETSMTQNGIHILFFVDSMNQTEPLQEYSNKNNKLHLEFYTGLKDNRFIILTGNTMNECRTMKTINIVDLNRFINKYMAKDVKTSKTSQNKPLAQSSASDDVINYDAIIDDAIQCDDVLYNLWNRTNLKTDDESSNDLSLLNKLAYYCNCDYESMKHQFERSYYYATKDAQHIVKWMREDYRQRTINKAITGTAERLQNNNIVESQKQAKFEFLDISTIINAYENENALKAKFIYYTGIKQIDETIHGLQNGLNVIGAISGTGKTTFANQICMNLAKRGVYTLFISLEMTSKQMMFKAISNLSNINSTGLTIDDLNQKRQYADNTKMALYQQAVAKLNALNGYYNIVDINQNIKNANDIIQCANDFKNKFGYHPVLFVDFIQRLENGTDKTIIDANLSALQDFGIKNNLPIVVISQLGRSANEFIKNGTPYNALYGSNGIEHLASTIMLMYQESNEHHITIDVVKSKESETKNGIKLHFIKQYCKFVDADTKTMQQEQQAQTIPTTSYKK